MDLLGQLADLVEEKHTFQQVDHLDQELRDKEIPEELHIILIQLAQVAVVVVPVVLEEMEDHQQMVVLVVLALLLFQETREFLHPTALLDQLQVDGLLVVVEVLEEMMDLAPVEVEVQVVVVLEQAQEIMELQELQILAVEEVPVVDLVREHLM